MTGFIETQDNTPNNCFKARIIMKKKLRLSRIRLMLVKAEPV